MAGFKKLNPALFPLVATASLAAITPSYPAKALDFAWQFNNTDGGPTITNGGIVTGTISGLLDNRSGQTGVGPGDTPLTVTVTSAPNTPSGGWINDWAIGGGSGFTVANGQVTASNAFFLGSSGGSSILNFGSPQLAVLMEPTLINSDPTGTVTFTPISSVPGPVPILGAISAFGWSRRVRKRLRAAQPASQA